MISVARLTSNSRSSAFKPPVSGLGFKTTALLFLLVLAATIAHHLSNTAPKVILIYDALHYLETCRQLTKCLLPLLHGQLDIHSFSHSDLTSPLLVDGPVFPGLYALVFALLGRIPEHSDWRILVIGQSLLHAFNACLIAALSFTLTRKKILSLSCGILWGLYPAAILGSGQFLTETLCISLLLSYLWSLTTRQDSRLTPLLSGLVMGLLILLKPALIPATVICAGLSCYGRGQAKSTAALMLAAATIVILPWMLYTKEVTGKASLTTQRFPASNLAFGCDTEAGGYGVMPTPPLTDLLTDNDCPMAPVLGQWLYKQPDCWRMTVAKISSILGAPWNDFRHALWGINAGQQTGLHVIMLFLGLLAIACRAFKLQPLPTADSRKLFNLCLIMGGGQLLVYLAFVAVSRYGLTIMPVMFILACSGIWSFVSGIISKPWRTLTCSGLAALSCLFIINTSAWLLPQLPEISYRLPKGGSVEKQIDLSTTVYPHHSGSTLLLLDGSAELSKAEITVNGHRLDGHPRLIYHYQPSAYPILPIIRQQAAAMGINIDSLRQWRAIPVPNAFLNCRGLNHITLRQPDQAATIYANASDSTRHLPSWRYLAFHKMFASAHSLEARLPNPIGTGNARQKSLLQNTPASEPASLSGSLRIHLLPLPNLVTELKQSRAFKQNIAAADFDPLLRDPQTRDVIRINKNALKFAASNECRLTLPSLPPSSHLSIRLSGQIRCLKGPGKIGIPLVLIGQSGDYHVLDLPAVYINAAPNWKTFAIDDLVPTKLLQSPLKHFAFNLYPCPWTDAHYGSDANFSDAQLRQLKVEITPINAPEISGESSLIY